MLRMRSDELPDQRSFPGAWHAKEENAWISLLTWWKWQLLVPERTIAFSLGLDPLIEDLHHPPVEHALGLGTSRRGVEARIGEKPIKLRNQGIGDRAILSAQSLPHFPTRLALIRAVGPEGMAEVDD